MDAIEKARKAIADVALLETKQMAKIGEAIARYDGSKKLMGAVREARAGKTLRLRFFFQDFARKASDAAVLKIVTFVDEPGRLASPAEHLARLMDDLG